MSYIPETQGPKVVLVPEQWGNISWARQGSVCVGTAPFPPPVLVSEKRTFSPAQPSPAMQLCPLGIFFPLVSPHCSFPWFSFLLPYSAQDQGLGLSKLLITVTWGLPPPQFTEEPGRQGPKWHLPHRNSRILTPRSWEKERPLSIVTCPVYAIKWQKEGTQLAVNKSRQLLWTSGKWCLPHCQTLIISAPVSSGSVQEEFVVEWHIPCPSLFSRVGSVSADFSKIFFLLVSGQFWT